MCPFSASIFTVDDDYENEYIACNVAQARARCRAASGQATYLGIDLILRLFHDKKNTKDEY